MVYEVVSECEFNLYITHKLAMYENVSTPEYHARTPRSNTGTSSRTSRKWKDSIATCSCERDCKFLFSLINGPEVMSKIGRRIRVEFSQGVRVKRRRIHLRSFLSTKSIRLHPRETRQMVRSRDVSCLSF